eukprot:12636182-Ditylum_brightwellii.AAC.1
MQSTFIESQAAAEEKKDNLEEAKCLHSLISKELQREKAWRMRNVVETERKKGVISVTQESTVLDGKGSPIIDKDIKEVK